MAEETMWVRGSGGAEFEVVVTPRVLKKLKRGVLVQIEPPKARRAPAGPKAPRGAKEPQTAAETAKPGEGDGPGADGSEGGAQAGPQAAEKPAEDQGKAG